MFLRFAQRRVERALTLLSSRSGVPAAPSRAIGGRLPAFCLPCQGPPLSPQRALSFDAGHSAFGGDSQGAVARQQRPQQWTCFECGARNEGGADCACGRRAPRKPARSGRTRAVDWKCGSCGANNFKRNETCFECGNAAPEPPPQANGPSRSASRRQEGSGSQMKLGDWMCETCDFHNFARNVKCHRCAAGRPESAEKIYSGQEIKLGDWFCASCSNHNYAKRGECFRCGDPKPASATRPAPAFKKGDWMCPKCSCHNFAARTECYICAVARPEPLPDSEEGARAIHEDLTGGTPAAPEGEGETPNGQL